MQRVIWICIQVHMDWVYSLVRSALIFEADDGNPVNVMLKLIPQGIDHILLHFFLLMIDDIDSKIMKK